MLASVIGEGEWIQVAGENQPFFIPHFDPQARIVSVGLPVAEGTCYGGALTLYYLGPQIDLGIQAGA
jgi:hypothetical protein